MLSRSISPPYAQETISWNWFPLTIMFIVSVNEGAHTVVPQLDDPIVKAGQDPWPGRVEGQTLHTMRFGFVLRQHYFTIASSLTGKQCQLQLASSVRMDHALCGMFHVTKNFE